MSKNITFREFESINSFSNANIEKVLRAYINESANAALVSTYDDGAILFDVNEEKFYSANYSFDKEKLQVVLENFEEISLREDEKVNFKLAAKDYFLNEETSISALTNSYSELMEKPIASVEKIISEAVADKDFSITADFEELSYLNEEFNDLHEEEFFKSYKNRLLTNPLSDILVLNWKDPVAFSLYESTEPEKYLNSKGKEKAKMLFKNKKFKKDLTKACAVFKEDIEEGGNLIYNLYEEYPSLFFLTNNELKESLARVIITSPSLQNEYKQIVEGFKIFISESADLEELKYSTLGEAIDIGSDVEDGEKEDGEKEDGEEKEDDKEEKDKEKDDKDEKAKELTAEEKEKLISALKKVVEKSLDDKIKEMAQDLLDKFDTEDEGTKPDEVKEAVRFLSVSL